MRSQSLTTPKPILSKLMSSAERKVGAAIKNRWGPQRKNFHYDVRENVSNGPDDRKQFEINNKVMKGVIHKTQTSEQRLAEKQEQQAKELKQLQRAKVAKYAAVKVKDTNFIESMDKDAEDRKRQERKTYLKRLTSVQVFSLARTKVDQQLQLIDATHPEERIFQNDAFNRAAMTLVQSCANARSSKLNYYATKINLGGGLWLSPDDINKISQDLLNPIHGEIGS